MVTLERNKHRLHITALKKAQCKSKKMTVGYVTTMAPTLKKTVDVDSKPNQSSETTFNNRRTVLKQQLTVFRAFGSSIKH